MKPNYYPETDSLYVEPSDKLSVENKKISEGIVPDYDAKGNPIGIDIDNTSKKLDLKKPVLAKLPTETQTLSA